MFLSVLMCKCALTSSKRYCGIWVVFPEPVSPSMISTWCSRMAASRSSLYGKMGRLLLTSCMDCFFSSAWERAGVSRSWHAQVKQGLNPNSSALLYFLLQIQQLKWLLEKESHLLCQGPFHGDGSADKVNHLVLLQDQLVLLLLMLPALLSLPLGAKAEGGCLQSLLLPAALLSSQLHWSFLKLQLLLGHLLLRAGRKETDLSKWKTTLFGYQQPLPSEPTLLLFSSGM